MKNNHQSKTNPNDYFLKIFKIEPIYEVENNFHEPFWKFMYRFQSLYKHWILNKDYMNNHLEQLYDVEFDNSAEMHDIFDETVGTDFEFFPEYLRLSTISFGLSLFENLLGDLSSEISNQLNIDIDLDKRSMPFINKYILWLSRGLGLDINIDKSDWKELDAIRELRNRFIHQIDRDIPNKIKKTISEIIGKAINYNEIISDDLVNASLEKISSLVKIIELSYIDFYRKRNNI